MQAIRYLIRGMSIKTGGKGLMIRVNYTPVSDSVRLSVDISGCKAQGFFCWNEGRQ